MSESMYTNSTTQSLHAVTWRFWSPDSFFTGHLFCSLPLLCTDGDKLNVHVPERDGQPLLPESAAESVTLHSSWCRSKKQTVWEQCSKQRPVVQCVAALLEQTGVAFRRRGATRSRVRYIQQGQSVSILHHWYESVQWLSWRADVLTFATAALQLYTIQPVAKETETQQPVLAQRFMSVQWDS